MEKLNDYGLKVLIRLLKDDMTMNEALTRVGRTVMVAGAVVLSFVRDLLASATKPETSDRPLGDGSDLFGEHNFRTGRPDVGV